MANKNIRQSQLISPWGVGQVVPFPNDESLMVAGLDAWEMFLNNAENKEEFVFHELRLEQRLGVTHFKMPPDFRQTRDGQRVKNANLHVPFVRFPRWHYCRICGHMEQLSVFDQRTHRCPGVDFGDKRSCLAFPEGKRPTLIPMRFITICSDGHIDDFPFIEWVHRGNNCQNPHLRYQVSGSSTALSAIKITCVTCGLSKRMTRTFREHALRDIKSCNGLRPWLGEVEGNSHCGKDLNVVLRGASNVYFPDIKSSIYVPSLSQSTFDRLSNIIEEKHLLIGTDGQINSGLFEYVARECGVNPQELIDVAIAMQQRLLTSNDLYDNSEESFRLAEYDVLENGTVRGDEDFVSSIKDICKYDPEFSKFFSKITLIHKLRETRALVGFSRLYPEDGKTLSQKKAQLSRYRSSWLPGIIVRGEGIFLTLNEHLLDKWQHFENVVSRIDRLIENYNRLREGYHLPPKDLSASYVLLHSLAHLLINELSIRSGYSSSSLRERIYWTQPASKQRMCGFLIYTASGDSEGSLGGLVNQGLPGKLERVFFEGVERNRWCSSDPICIESQGQGPSSSNLAACHNCILLPETSCEEANRLLDRGVIVGLPSDPTVGYLNTV